MTAGIFRGAIRRVGETISLVRTGGTRVFDGSLQPRKTEDASGPAGYGTDYRAVLYAAADEVTASLREGDLLRAKSGDYRLVSIEDITLAGKTVYRKGTAARLQPMEEEGNE